MTALFDRPYFFPALTTSLFTLAIAIGVVSADLECRSGWTCLVQPGAKVLLALGFIALIGWFLHAFTQADGPPDAACEALQRASMFRFAYVFSVYSFALLVLPFTAMLRGNEAPPDAGPIRMLRACVVPATAPEIGASAAARTSPIEYCPTAAREAKGGAAAPAEVTYYPWLVAVGGVVALECGSDEAPCAGRTGKGTPMYRVEGGFVVPFYALVFAFVGGVVNLTRRVPEYQKRSSCHFTGTATEPMVTLLEAREFVVFQIMQFLSAPFVAMVAYYAFEPKGVTTAAVTGFFSGFATESVLLLLRGMFNGLRPETTKPAATAVASPLLHVVVMLPDGGGAAAAATVEVRRLPTGPAVASQASDAKGEVTLRGLPAGTVWVEASLAGAAQGALKAAAQKVQLKAGETESVTLVLR